MSVVNLVYNLNQLSENLTGEVGFKSLDLLKLSDFGIPTPNSFVITTSAVKIFFDSIDLTNIDVPAVERIIVSHGDPDGNYTFTRYLRVLAILCRMPGESLPHAEREKRAFIAERMQFFEGIDTKTALDVDFFLLNILTACEMILPVIGSLILPAFAVVAEMSAWNERHIPGL
jgi:hypothetical protein